MSKDPLSSPASRAAVECLADSIPDVRDGLTRKERIILYILHETQRELQGRPVPSVMLYGRVCEHLDLSESEFRAWVEKLGIAPDRLR